MSTENARSYSCRDAELTAICNFVVFSLKRDLADFTGFSPKFNAAYISDFENAIAAASEVIEPKSETLERKMITQRLYNTMDGLIDMINRFSAYIKMARLPINATEFGISALRKSVKSRDAEGAIQNLRTVSSNIAKYKDLLAAQGLTEELSAQFATAGNSIAMDNQKQYEIASNRKNIVQNNLDLLNGLYEQLIEILNVGKILYMQSDPDGYREAKVEEYTFRKLKSNVRMMAKAKEETVDAT